MKRSMLIMIKQSRKAREEERVRLTIQNPGVTPLWEGVWGFRIKSATEVQTSQVEMLEEEDISKE